MIENPYCAAGASLPTVTLRAEPGKRRIGLPFCCTMMLSTGGLGLSSFMNSHDSTVLVYVVFVGARILGWRGGSPCVWSVCSVIGALCGEDCPKASRATTVN